MNTRNPANPSCLKTSLLPFALLLGLLGHAPVSSAASVDLFMVIHADLQNYTLQQTISPEAGSVALVLPPRSDLSDIVFIGAGHEALSQQYKTEPQTMVLEKGSVIVRHSGQLQALLVPRDDGSMEFMLQPILVDIEFSGDSQIRQSASVMLPAGLEFVSRQNVPYDTAEARHQRKLKVVTSGVQPLRIPIRFRLVDADADGVADPADLCLDSPKGALVDTQGCEPDTDADGVSDLLDLCPASSAAAKVNQQGCEPDTDQDGVVDRFDLCNDTRADTPVTESGCDLDADFDGVVDTNDQCPDSAPGEPVNSQGCSLDFDKDGVANFRDLCAGTDFGRAVDASGCEPDKDQDGISDRLDVCQQTPRGTEVDRTGCALDTDADGIPDYRDLCAVEAKNVDSFGCSETAAGSGIILEEVFFSGSSASLDLPTRNFLDRVARAVNFHQPTTFELSAHTVEQEDSTVNQQVSNARAEAARQYLMVRGVPPNQVLAKGYGDSRPLKPSGNTEQPANKQRVELRVMVD